MGIMRIEPGVSAARRDGVPDLPMSNIVRAPMHLHTV